MILIPIIIFVSYPNIKNILIEKYGDNIQSYIKAEKKIIFKNFEIKLRKNLLSTEDQINENNLFDKIHSISNNRVDAWDFLLQIFFKNKLNEKMKNQLMATGYDLNEFKKIKKRNLITGYGPQADRHLMFNTSKVGVASVTKGPFGYNASNGIIYSLICSGLLGMFCFITINLIIFKKSITLLIHHFKMSNLNSKPFLSASIFSILFLQMRALYENSFSIFGVDLIIFISAYIIVQNEYRKLSN